MQPPDLFRYGKRGEKYQKSRVCSIGIKLTYTERAWLERQAKKMHTTISNVARQLILKSMIFLIALSFSMTLKAQARYVQSVDVDLDQGLGFDIPVLEFDSGVEVPIGRSIELDGFGAYAYAKKVGQKSGQDFIASVTPIAWITGSFGVTSNIRYSYLHSGQDTLGEWIPAPGVLFRAYPLGMPSRLWLDYALPIGGISKNGTESKELQGPEFKWEVNMKGPFRMAFSTAIYRGLNQGAVYCYPTCKRSSFVTGNASISFELVFPRPKNDEEVW